MSQNSFSQITERNIAPVDGRAKEEEKNIINKTKRDGQFDKVTHVIRVCFIILCSLIVFIVIACIVFNLIIPENKYFTNETQKKLNDFFVEGSIGGLIYAFFKLHVIDGGKRKE